MISAAMAESVATERGLRRVVSCSAIDPARLSQVRSLLREKSSCFSPEGSAGRGDKPLFQCRKPRFSAAMKNQG